MLNINENNWGMWSALTHMGYNMETIALFLNTPYMNALALDEANGAGLINQGGTDEAVTMLEDAKKLIAAERKSQEVSSTSQLNGYMALNKVTMLQVIQGKANLTALQKAIFTEQIADAHDKLVLAHGGIMSLQSLMKHDTKNAKTRSALELDLYTGNTFMKYEGLYGDSGLRVTKPSTMVRLRQNTVSGQVFETLTSVRRAVLDLRGDSVYRTAMFDELMQSYGDMAMTGRTNMNAFQAGTALNSYLSEVRRYLNAKWVTEITGKNIAQVRKEMTGEGTGMAARLVNLRASNEEVRDNLFIKQLIPMVNPKEGYSRIEFTGDRVINVSPIEMHGAFLALARSEDVQVRQLAEDLVVYSLLNGGAVGSRSYNKYIPAAMLQQLGIRDALGTSGVEYMLSLIHISEPTRPY